MFRDRADTDRLADIPPLSRGSWLDHPLSALLVINGEKALYGLFIGLALLSRLWDLGYHVLSHDETVHAYWSWYLYQGVGYQHDPLSHGPFLFHSTALSFYLFGDSEFTARLVPALLGVALVALPYTLRRWLGRAGALIASLMFLISPSLLYYSRYARNDVPIVVWALLAALAIFRYLGIRESYPSPRGAFGFSDGRTRWLTLLAAAMSLMFATKEVAFFYVAIFGLFLICLFFARLGPPGRGAPARRHWRGLLQTTGRLVALLLVASGLVLFTLNLVELFPIHYSDCGQAPVPDPLSGGLQCAAAGCGLIRGGCQRQLPVVAGDNVIEYDPSGLRVAVWLTRPEMLFVALGISLVALLSGVGAWVLLRRWMPFEAGARPSLDLILLMGSFTLPFLSHILISGISRVASRWFFGVDAAFNSLDYSEAGLLRSSGFVCILLAVAIAVGLWWDWRRWLAAAGVFYGIFVLLFTTVFTNGNGLASGLVGSLGYWLEQQAVERGSQPFYYYGLMVPLYEYLPLVAAGAATLYLLMRVSRGRKVPLFIAFLLFWTVLTWPIYTAAGERMPWMVVHFVPPMILSGSWILGKLFTGVDWGDVLRRGGWAIILLVPVGLAAMVQAVSPWLLGPAQSLPFSGFGVKQLNVTQHFLVALLVLLIVAAVLRSVWQRLGVVTVGRTLAALALAILAVLTIRTAWAFAYLRPDDASEFLVYAHGSPDVRVVMDEVETLSRRVSRGLSLDIGYTSDGSYPIMWYLRNYPNAVRLPNPAGRQDLDKSVILAGDKEWAGIEPFLGLDYFCRHYDFMWWPMQDYYGLNWKRVVFALTDPAMRSAFWDIIFRRDYRRYEQATGKTIQPTQWPQRNGFRFCVRRKVIDELWGEAAAPNSPTEAATGSNSLPGPVRSPIVDLKIASLGSLGAWNGPHGLAIDADGFLYVADTYNHRVVKLSPQGDVVYAWQSTWWRGLSSWKPNGCLDGNDRPLALGEGEFCEPWGVAVGPDGRVFVADTWNHRVQVFGPDGTFLHSLGTFGTSGGDVASAPLQFYGPRDVAVDEQGNLYVSDTGNKRIQLFDTDLNYLRAVGGPGVLPGRLDEPVGVAIGPDRLLYVADTWNQRIQVFTSQGDFVRAWPVVGWTGQSAANKPYIRVDLDRHIYATDPEGARVLLFDATGTMLGVVDFRLIADDSLTSPFGILPDGHGRLWISDAAGQRLLRLLLEDLAPTE